LLLPDFLALQAASRRGKSYFRLSSKQTTNLASINTKDLNSFQVLVPSLEVQERVAMIAKSIDERIDTERGLLKQWLYFKSIVTQELLSGRLRLSNNVIADYRDGSDQAA
jgi:type I restriction enzyme S subunit